MTNAFYQLPFIGILRGISEEDIPVVFEAAIEAGLPAIEITINTENVFKLISEARKKYSRELQIGAGTVLDAHAAKNAIEAGASFIVSPCNPDDVADFCSSTSTPYFPGALSPSEIWKAWKTGATMVKVFPANIFGPRYFQEIKAPLDSVKLLACGGVSAATIADFCQYNADGFAFGSSIFKPEWIKNRDKTRIKNTIIELIREYSNFSGKNSV